MFQVLFWASKVDYLGHVVGQDGVKVDPKHIQAMLEWPHPKTLKSPCGVLGVMGYYKNGKIYGKITSPLTNIIKEITFTWNEVVKQELSNLKQAMCTTLVLIVQNFTKSFLL